MGTVSASPGRVTLSISREWACGEGPDGSGGAPSSLPMAWIRFCSTSTLRWPRRSERSSGQQGSRCQDRSGRQVAPDHSAQPAGAVGGASDIDVDGAPTMGCFATQPDRPSQCPPLARAVPFHLVESHRFAVFPPRCYQGGCNVSWRNVRTRASASLVAVGSYSMKCPR